MSEDFLSQEDLDRDDDSLMSDFYADLERQDQDRHDHDMDGPHED